MKLRGVVLDMDGVLWHGDKTLPGFGELFEALGQLKLPFILATNNATKTVTQYTEELARFGVQVSAEQILTSPGAAVDHLKEHFAEGTRVYVVGEAALHETVSAAGFTVIGPLEVRNGQTAAVVVGGLTTTSLSYDLLAMASLLVRQGAAFVATNYDLTYPAEMGQLPGAGAVLSVITSATGVEPTVVGKPHAGMFQAAAKRLGVRPEKILMVGDRLETDILGAKEAGFKTALLLTGVSKREDIGDTESSSTPDYVLDDLAALIQVLHELRADT